ncbi:pp2a regulatory subunit tap46 [Quercus suber]|uniref:Pp2a regulatory subunit tap46 n=1 Tax=Quercus suber TaxID=58331 RepID=A0AAW0JNS7_QUESU
MEIMNKWQERNVKLMEEANHSWYKDNRMPRPGEEDDEDDDAVVEKARRWDDWKDENPRGAGYKYASDSDIHKEGNLEDSIVPMTRFLLLSPQTNT